MTLFEAINAKIAFYRQVALFGLQRDDPKVVELCINVLWKSLPKDYQKKVVFTDRPKTDGKLKDQVNRELLDWCFANLPLVEEQYTEYQNALALKYQH